MTVVLCISKESFTGRASVFSCGILNVARMFTNRSFKGFLYVTILYVTSLIAAILVMGPTLILLWLQPRWFRWINDRFVAIWLTLPPVRTFDIQWIFDFLIASVDSLRVGPTP